MAKAKAKKVEKQEVKTSGVNLEGLTLEQLQLLQGEIFQKTEKMLDSDKEKKLEELKNSGKLQELRASAKEFRKQVKAFAKGGQFNLVLPITFVLKGQVDEEFNPFDYETVSLEDFLTFNFTVKLDGANLTKRQKAVLASVVEDYVENACSDIWDIVPDELTAPIEAFEKQFNAFLKNAKEAKALGLEL